jgi:hypothetical protein
MVGILNISGEDIGGSKFTLELPKCNFHCMEHVSFMMKKKKQLEVSNGARLL